MLINNTTYPIAVVGRDDDDCVFELDKFETESTIVRCPDAIEYSYDKLESVIRQYRSTLRKAVTMKATHAIAPQTATDATPIVTTSCEVTGTRSFLHSPTYLRSKNAMTMPIFRRIAVILCCILSTFQTFYLKI